ncbi:MAG: ABC transporter substrate-binding protein [Geobacteraceae bacterium]|nr:ABC transporter substrate-binding protein [Geobacteraceae bacterium]
MMIRIKWLFTSVALLFIFSLLPPEAWGERRIGVLMWSEEPRYIETKQGITEQLAKEGFREPAVKFTVENADGNKAKAAEAVAKFAAAKPDLIIVLGTPAAIAVTREIKDVPVVFSLVYDPVESKIAEDWRSSGNNTTGTSTRVPLAKLMQTLRELAPVKRVAALYTPKEKNSELQLKELQGLQDAFRVKVIPVPLASTDDVALLLPEVLRSVDAVYLSGSLVVASEISTIAEMATRAKVLTVTHLSDLVEKGALLGVCADYRALGRLAGEKGAKVLKGARPASIPIETQKRPDVVLNMRTVKGGGFKVPRSFMKSVTKVVE